MKTLQLFIVVSVLFCGYAIAQKDNDSIPVPAGKTLPATTEVSAPAQPAGFYINGKQVDISDREQMSRLQTQISIEPADIILLCNGESYEGVIREKTKDIISLETEYGLKIFNLKDVEFIDEISERRRFDLLQKLEVLQRYHQKKDMKVLKQEKKDLQKQEQIAQLKKNMLEGATGKKDTDLFTLSKTRLEEIIKEFAQFSPDYWRYYHRKSDAVKITLELNRLKKYAHPAYKDTIDLYLKAFEYKKKEMDESQGSALVRQYRDKYKVYFRNAEQKRITILNPYDR